MGVDGLYTFGGALDFANQNVDSWEMGVCGFCMFEDALDFANQNVNSWQMGVDGLYMFEGAPEFTNPNIGSWQMGTAGHVLRVRRRQLPDPPAALGLVWRHHQRVPVRRHPERCPCDRLVPRGRQP